MTARARTATGPPGNAGPSALSLCPLPQARGTRDGGSKPPFRQPPCPTAARLRRSGADQGDAASTKAYSCCASRMIKARFPSRSPTTKVKPSTVGSIEMKEMVPSSFLREATALCHFPKSKMVTPPSVCRFAAKPKGGFRDLGAVSLSHALRRRDSETAPLRHFSVSP
jgi:hypothetical protein